MPVKLRYGGDPDCAVFGDDGWPESVDDLGDWSRDDCPFGKPGDRLLVKETWRMGDGVDPYKPTYKADWPDVERNQWQSPVTMPRELVRLKPIVKAVWVERLHSATYQDCRAMGCVAPCERYSETPNDESWFAVGEEYSNGWDAIYGKTHFWADNPWVWVCDIENEAAS